MSTTRRRKPVASPPTGGRFGSLSVDGTALQAFSCPDTNPGEAPAVPAAPIELSVVMPCLNEAETLARCIAKAQRSLRALTLGGEVIVADNGSLDGSQAIAAQMGAR